MQCFDSYNNNVSIIENTNDIYMTVVVACSVFRFGFARCMTPPLPNGWVSIGHTIVHLNSDNSGVVVVDRAEP